VCCGCSGSPGRAIKYIIVLIFFMLGASNRTPSFRASNRTPSFAAVASWLWLWPHGRSRPAGLFLSLLCSLRAVE
jgi:hypothetical protein